MVSVLKDLQFKHKEKHTHRQGRKSKPPTAAKVMISIQGQPVLWFLCYGIIKINFFEGFRIKHCNSNVNMLVLVTDMMSSDEQGV